MFEVTIFTILPKNWSNQKVQEIISSPPNCMIRRAKQPVMYQGFMSSPNPRTGKTLNEVTVEVIKSFCNSEEVSRVMPNKKDYTSIKVCDVKVHE
jgi:hypothetical protein